MTDVCESQEGFQEYEFELGEKILLIRLGESRREGRRGGAHGGVGLAGEEVDCRIELSSHGIPTLDVLDDWE